MVFQRFGDEPAWAEVAGIGLELFTQKLTGLGRVCGVMFRPGGFRPFAPKWPVSEWTGRRVPLADVVTGAGQSAVDAVVLPDQQDARVAALDAFLLGLAPQPDPHALHAMELVEEVRSDRSVRRVAELAAAEGVSARSLQRLFATYVGVGPKWVILRYRIHEALDRAEYGDNGGCGLDWAALAAELGYSDQAHLVRDFTATVGVPPTAYARAGAA